MEGNGNIFFYGHGIEIGGEKSVIVPEPGDLFAICKDRESAYRGVIEYHDRIAPEYGLVEETYSTERLGDGVADYTMCERLSIGDSEFDFVGMKSGGGKEKSSARVFYLY